MTTVTGTMVAPGGERPNGASITITLVDLEGYPATGYTTDSEVIGITTVTPDNDGNWSATLIPNASITCDRGETLYRVQEKAATGRRALWYIKAPATGTHHVSDLTVPLQNVAEPIAGFVRRAGDTMTGPLILPGSPEGPLEAATKAYVDAHSGGGGGGFYAHTQSTPAATWSIPHGLGYRPNVAVADADGNLVDAAIAWPTVNTVTVSLGAATSGTAYLS